MCHITPTKTDSKAYMSPTFFGVDSNIPYSNAIIGNNVNKT